jgi:hypothetical protein
MSTMTTVDRPPLLTVEDVQARLGGVSRKWVYRHQDELQAVHVGQFLRFKPHFIDRIAEEGVA